ncbi:SRPBCC domain-containing protein [Streptomyces sp. NPDC006314]|uniref:SRPBCC domain-containing protein n=1 Tax=Streptomyces sp. NPDC006314 TaxID=3154475 RepID=UPI0033A70223
MSGSIEQGTSQTHGNTHILHFLVRIPRRMEDVWSAVATPEGLGGWFTAVDVLEPRLDGAVTLRDLGAGRVTAWDVDRVAEYTVGDGGRLRFHLERDGDQGTVLRFTHEFQDEGETESGWRARFERLIAVLEPSPDAPGQEPSQPLPGQFT